MDSGKLIKKTTLFHILLVYLESIEHVTVELLVAGTVGTAGGRGACGDAQLVGSLLPATGWCGCGSVAEVRA